jgi:hypothetical protein
MGRGQKRRITSTNTDIPKSKKIYVPPFRRDGNNIRSRGTGDSARVNDASSSRGRAFRSERERAPPPPRDSWRNGDSNEGQRGSRKRSLDDPREDRSKGGVSKRGQPSSFNTSAKRERVGNQEDKNTGRNG